MIEGHRSAITFDLRHFFGLSIADIGETVSYREALDLIHELTFERSHLMASLLSWARPMSQAEMLAQAQLNMQLERKNQLPWPWDQPRHEYVTPAEQSELRASLEARSAL